MKTVLWITSIAWIGGLAAPAWATTYVIKPDGSGDFPTIQAGIATASAGDVLALTDGTFTGSGNRDLDYMGKAIVIRSQSGNPDACVIDCAGSVATPHRGFYFHSGETTSSVLEGVTVANGFLVADAPFPPGSYGAGVYCTANSSPRLTRCVLLNNTAGGTGGGMLCEQSSPKLEQCTFSGNTAQIGGGLLLSSSPNVTLTECTFSGNTSSGAGGGMAIGFCSATLTDCIFSANHSAKNGAGLWSTGASTPTLSGCQFIGNVAADSWSGGGLSCENSASPKLDWCTFADNGAGYGGGVAAGALSSPVLTSCTIRGNHAVNFGGGVFAANSSSPGLEQCTLFGNSAPSGGGLANFGTLTIDHTIVAFGIQGGAIYCSSPAVTLTCSDLDGNVGGDWVACIAAQLGTAGNLAADPLFCDSSSNNFRVQAISPCAPDKNPTCGLIGAWPGGCFTPAIASTWGQVKARYR